MTNERDDLLSAIRSEAPNEMWEAAKELVRREDIQASDDLLDVLLHSPDDARRVAAAWALGSLRSEKAVQALRDILDTKSQPASLRDQAAESLGYLEDARARDVLVRNLGDTNADVVFSCIFALRTVGELEDIRHLENFTHRDNRNSYGASIADEAREAIEEIRQRVMRHEEPS